jgi:CMP-N,N'-diacetyllegionaminic acid synthase
MIDSKKILAVVPARGGSKGIPLKNLRCIGGKSLVAMAGEVANAISEIDRKIVSTDHLEIARIAMSAGLDCPFMRPEEISGDRISDWDVLIDTLYKVEEIDGIKYDIIAMLQPTSPMRKSQDVLGVINMLIDGGYDSVWSVSATDSKSHPYKQLIVKDGGMDYWDMRGDKIIARQQLDPVYHRNGVAYAITRECLLDQKTIKGKKAGAYIISSEQISIDTEWDLKLAEFILAQQLNSEMNL